jgi:hypothetical protein
MKPETKLALRRRLLMILRAILWHADEWLHRQELALREELERVAPARAEKIHSPNAGSTPAARSKVETFLEWEARRSGVAPVAKKSRRRGLSAREFDLRFAR